MRHGRKLALFVAISLAVHVCILWFVGRTPPPDKAKRPPVTLTLRAPPPPPPPPVVEVPKPKVAEKSRVVAQAPVVPVVNEEPTPIPEDPKPEDTSGSPRADSSSPRADKRVSSGGTIVKLGDGALLGLAGDAPRARDQPRQQNDDGLDEMTRVNQRLARDIEGFRVGQDTKTGARHRGELTPSVA